MVGNLKGKAQDLLEHKEHVPGLKDVKKQLRQLEKRWTSLKEISDDRRKSLETLVDDLKDFRETHDSLSSWLAQKEKMVTVLGPVATEPAMVNNQLQQVKVSNIPKSLILFKDQRKFMKIVIFFDFHGNFKK